MLLLSRPSVTLQVSRVVSHVGTSSVGALVPECHGWPMHLDLSVLRPFGIRRDNSPVTGAEQLYQLSLGKLKYPVILAVWSLKLSPTYHSRQNQGPAKLNRALPETFKDR